MDMWFWALEYGKVFLGYLFLMFLWPSIVFNGHLRKKSKTYRFSFCTTVMIVLINTLVLVLGLVHVLTPRVIRIIFWVVFLLAFLKNIVVLISRKYIQTVNTRFSKARSLHGKYKFIIIVLSYIIVSFTYFKRAVAQMWRDCRKVIKSHNWFKVRIAVKKYFWTMGRRFNRFFWKYGFLTVIVLFGMLYFSYGAFQVHSYGAGDLYTHHEWIYELTNGNIFAAGVYPEAMHCFVYTLHVLFGIHVHSILLFLQGIHVMVLLISAYILLRKVLHWRYMPIFVLALFLILDLENADLIRSMYRLQMTLPQEFGLHTVFLCALYLMNYLREEHVTVRKGKELKFCWDENLFLFLMSLAACITIHFHVLIMAFIVCVSFALFALKKVFTKKRFVPLVTAVFCACLIAIAPMAGALAQGIPFNWSIDWAVSAMSGEESRELRNQETEPEENGETGEDELQDIKQNGINFVNPAARILSDFYEEGYVKLYGEIRGTCYALVTVVAALFCLVALTQKRFQAIRGICSSYPPVILASVLYVLIYAAPMLGLPDIIPEGRFFALGHILLLAVMAIPLDLIFFGLAYVCNDFIMRALSLCVVAGVYVGTIAVGSFRGYLFFEVTRYNAAAVVTERIVNTFPEFSYTVVAPSDEIFLVSQYGWHEELLRFAENCNNEDYSIPSEYVFIYVEKRPLLYAQSYFFDGPAWMGEEKYLEPYWETYHWKYPDRLASQSPDLISAEVSKEEAQKEIPQYYNSWTMYLQPENRIILESKVYEWCQRFASEHQSVLNVYYEDDDFVCYYFRQDPGNPPYKLGIE